LKKFISIEKKFVIIFIFILLSIIPILGIIGEIYLPYNITPEMTEHWLYDISYFVYSNSFYISPFTTVIQLIYSIILMIRYIKSKNMKAVLLSSLLLIFTLTLVALSFLRLLAAASVGP
jgi:hypothetical protein